MTTTTRISPPTLCNLVPNPEAPGLICTKCPRRVPAEAAAESLQANCPQRKGCAAKTGSSVPQLLAALAELEQAEQDPMDVPTAFDRLPHPACEFCWSLLASGCRRLPDAGRAEQTRALTRCPIRKWP